MADYRQIHTHIWKDEWFLDLSPQEKLLFIYLFSNSSTNLVGMYKIALRIIEFETGLPIEFVKQALDKFSKDGKVIYEDGYLLVVNMQKYNANSSPKVTARIQYELREIPDIPLKIRYFSSNIPYRYGMDTPSPLTNQDNPNQDNSEQNNAEQDKQVFVVSKDKDAKEAYRLYEQEIGLITPYIADAIGGELDNDIPFDWIKRAIEIAVANNARSWAYIAAVLKNWKENGFEDKRKKSNNGKQPAVKIDWSTCPTCGRQLPDGSACPVCTVEETEQDD